MPVAVSTLIAGGIILAGVGVAGAYGIVKAVNKTRTAREEAKESIETDWEAKSEYSENWTNMVIVVAIVGLLMFLAYVLFVKMNLFEQIGRITG